MQILVLNSGSSSIKFSFFEAAGDVQRSLFEGEVSGIGGAQPKVAFRNAAGDDLLPTFGDNLPALGSIPDAVAAVERLVTGAGLPQIDAIGYRVVHPGAHLRDHQRITEDVLQQLRDATAFAPLHDPTAVTIIEEMRRRFPGIGHYACFDTVFHQTMPLEATTYPLPEPYPAEGVHRYGFHGLSCESIVLQLREAAIPFPRRMVIAHLGGGCSVTALLDGASVDTSMGLTPTGGIVMATRPGDLDPGLMLFLVRQSGADAVEKMLNHDAGLAGLSGISGDMREVRAAADQGDPRAQLALEVFTRSVKKAIGGYLALLGGLDAIVFSGGIGEHDAACRAEILAGLESLGIQLDSGRNEEEAGGLHPIHAVLSPTAIYVVPAQEDRTIARHVARLSQTAQ